MKRILIFALAVMTAGCSSPKTADKPSVAVSIAPLKWVVENLADTMLDVRVLLPEGACAENFDPSPRQVAELDRADLFIQTGLLDFEKGLAGKIPEEKSVTLRGTVELIGGDDPHIWLSVRNMRRIAAHVSGKLQEKYPLMRETLQTRQAALDSTLAEMDARFSGCLHGGDVLIVHPSLSYMARDYGFNQIPLEADGKEPSAAYLRQVFDMISEKGIDRIYYSVQDNPQEAMAVASEAGIGTAEYDPLSPDWKNGLEKLVEDICRK